MLSILDISSLYEKLLISTHRDNRAAGSADRIFRSIAVPVLHETVLLIVGCSVGTTVPQRATREERKTVRAVGSGEPGRVVTALKKIGNGIVLRSVYIHPSSARAVAVATSRGSRASRFRRRPITRATEKLSRPMRAAVRLFSQHSAGSR